jgi:hypothetical protein
MIRNTITGSHPAHLHANGNARVLGWADDWFHGLAALQNHAGCGGKGTETPCELQIVTCSSYPPHTTAMERSAAYWGVGIVRLSPAPRTPWVNWLRHRMFADYCQHAKAEWVLCTDASDAIFTRHPQEALDTLHAMRQSALIAAERNPWPTDCRVPAYTGTYPFGNGGGIIGRRELLAELFEEACQHRSAACPRSDQYGTRMAAERLGVLPDTETTIFQTLAYTTPGEVELA